MHRTPHLRSTLALAAALMCTVACALAAQDRAARGGRGPAADLSVILGRPADRSVVLSVLSAKAVEARVEYGTAAGVYPEMTEPRPVRAGTPTEFDLAGLKPDTRYYYRLLTRTTGGADFRAEPEASFTTQRAPGAAFAFAVQGDSHPEREGKMYAPDLYALTMRNVAANPPDFYFAMGDDFSIERLIASQSLSQPAVDAVYAQQRGFLGVIGRSSSLFLVNGNHEQAARANLNASPNNPAVLAGRARTRLYPLPAPNAFYTGNAVEVPGVGLPRDYYAWTWGDALFVVLDFYWHSPVSVDNQAGGRQKEGGGGKKGGGRQKEGGGGGGGGGGGRQRDFWAITLGDAQYRWFADTLARSQARWKFVFCHHVLGTGRGAIEQARFYEWGGRDRDGTLAFAARRPGWPLPIHDLMVKHGVTIFFQGHDHLYAHQELDGVVYQEVPNPADSTYEAFNRDAYRSGTILPNSGHLRVTVAPENVRVDYVRSFLPADERAGQTNGMVARSYTLPARRAGTMP